MTYYQYKYSNNALLSVHRRIDCLSHRKVCTFETYPWWKLVSQLTCFVQFNHVKKASLNRLHLHGCVLGCGCGGAWVRGCVGGCVDFETPGRLGLEPSNSFPTSILTILVLPYFIGNGICQNNQYYSLLSNIYTNNSTTLNIFIEDKYFSKYFIHISECK